MIAQVFKDRTCDSIQPVLLDHARRDQHFSACRIVRNPLSFPLGNSLTSYSCRKSSVNVHDAPPRDSTAPVMHDPPHNARTGTDRLRDHAIRCRTPRRNLLHNPQDGFNEFFPHSSIILSTAHNTSRGSIGTTARSASAIGPGSSPSSPDTSGFTTCPSALTGSPASPPCRSHRSGQRARSGGHGLVEKRERPPRR